MSITMNPEYPGGQLFCLRPAACAELKQWRLSHKLTQRRAAPQFGLGHVAFVRLEEGGSVSQSLAERTSFFFNKSISEVFYLQEKPWALDQKA
jgi:DNA-binding XRE family transcriptional regulator